MVGLCADLVLAWPSNPIRPPHQTGATGCRRSQLASSPCVSRSRRIWGRWSICSRSLMRRVSASTTRSPMSPSQQLIERFARERDRGLAFTYAVTLGSGRTLVGLLQVRQLDPAFEAAEWECTIAPSSRGSGMFLEAARLVGSFAFGTRRRAPPRGARAAAERPRQRRAAQARRRAGRRAAPLDPPRRRILSIRCCGRC